MDARDDFFTLIHKALRRELFAVTVEAAALDWADRASAAAFTARWRALEDLLHQHSDHEDRHFFALAESKAPGATAPLSEQHGALERHLVTVGEELEAAAAGNGPLTVHRSMAAFVGAYLPHLDVEERQLMPLIWATCTDAELAATRAAFMAEMPPQVAAFSLRLMLPAITPRERVEVLARVQATAPPAVVQGTLALAADVLTPEAHARLLASLAA